MPAKPQYRNRSVIRSGKATGAHMQEALDDLQNQIHLMAQQTNANPTGSVQAPPQISSVSVSFPAPGVHQVSIQDNNPVSRGIVYHFEASTTADFSQPILVQSGPSRDHVNFYGKGPLFWRGFSQYPASPPSAPVYLGTPTSPTAADAGGAIARTGDLGGSGSGSEPTSNFRGGAGFGFDANRGVSLD